MSTEEEQTTPDEPKENSILNEVTPAVEQEIKNYINRFQEINITINQITKQTGDDESNTEIQQVGIHCQYNGAGFTVIIPINEKYNILQANYDLIEDMIYSSNHAELGGDFTQLESEEQWESYQTLRGEFKTNQLFSLCQSNRAIPLPTIEAWFSLLQTNSEKFILSPTKLNYEFIGGVVQRREYIQPTQQNIQTLYETVTQLISLRNGMQNILASAYISNGISVPDNFDSLSKDIDAENKIQSQTPQSKGFQ